MVLLPPRAFKIKESHLGAQNVWTRVEKREREREREREKASRKDKNGIDIGLEEFRDHTQKNT